MSSSSNGNNSQQENLDESWIEFGRTQMPAQVESDPVATSSPIKLTSNNKALEKLLLDAQKESSSASSRIDSQASSRASPHSQHSPTAEQSTNHEIGSVTSLQIDEHMFAPGEGGDHLVDGNWVWDWSSRPEAVPPSSSQFKHPAARKHRLSIRNTGLMRGIVFSLENLPLLIFTHACSFVLGAVSMVYYMRRFHPCSTVSSTPFDS